MSSDEEEEWDEVKVDTLPAEDGFSIHQAVSQNHAHGTIEIHLEKQTPKKRASGITREQRQARIHLHKVHLLCLIACGVIRNRWIQSEELQALILSCIPTKFITRAQSSGKTPSAFSSFVSLLARWWKSTFSVKYDDVKLAITKETFGSVEPALDRISCFIQKQNDTLSPELSVLAFCAGLRALGLECRLICSLHPIPLSFAGLSRTASNSTISSEENNLNSQSQHVPYPLSYWCEVYSQAHQRWLPVCPLRAIVDDIESMEPSPSLPKQLHYSYIIAYDAGNEQCGDVMLEHDLKDVTQRYAARFTTSTVKLRLKDVEWWNTTLWLYSKSYKTHKDEKEDAELKARGAKEPMPTTFAGFQNHPLYALERHCKKYEIIYPSDKEKAIGQFKGEYVFPRHFVQTLRTKENWLHLAKVIKSGEQPVKHVKARVSTIARKRRVESEKMSREKGFAVASDILGEDADSDKSALFGEWQTQPYEPPAVIDGKIPKNAFGNYELFHPDMMPLGCTHVQCKLLCKYSFLVSGIGKIARRLGIDYSPVVTGFEFHHGRVVPVLDGIIVESSHVQVLELAHQENKAHLEEKQAKELEKRVLKRWKLLIVKAMNRDRLFKEYLPQESNTTSVENTSDTASNSDPNTPEKPLKKRKLTIHDEEEDENL